MTLKKRTITLLFALLFVLASSPAAFAESSDYCNHWAGETIGEFLEKGWVQRDQSGELNPDQYATRAEFLTLINSIWPGSIPVHENKKEKNSDQSDQIKNSDDESAGDKEKSQLDDPIKREEAAYVIAGIKKYTKEEGKELSKGFQDSDQISPWALDSVEIMLQKGIMKGYPNQLLRPTDPITRAEAMTLLKAVLNLSD